MLFGDGPKGNKFANTGVGENNIDSPFFLGDGLVETIKVVQFLLATARDEDIGALFDEEFSGSQPNPFCAAGNDGGFAFELPGHCLSPLLSSESGTEASPLSNGL